MSQISAEEQIKAALIALLDGIKASDGERVANEMTRLDEMAAREKALLAPQLAHFLERRSYPKALAWLNSNGPSER